MNITRLALQNNRTSITLLVVLLLAGIQAFQTIPRAYDPGFIMRAAQVITQLPGASPERMERLVTDQIEEVIQEIPELDFINSESRTGVSIVTVNIKESYTDMRPIWDNLRRKIDKVTSSMPQGVIGPTVNDEFGDVFGIVLTLTGEGYTNTELNDVAELTRDEILQLDNVAKVEIHGVQEERIYIEYDNARLTELNLTPQQLGKILSDQNIVAPGGSFVSGTERIELEPTGSFDTLEDIQDVSIIIPGTQDVVYLSDIATIKRGFQEPHSKSVKSSGIPALSIAISMVEGGNNIELGDDVLALITSLQTQQPIGLEFEFINFSPKEVEEKVASFVSNLVQAIVVVAAVMLFSLGLRTGIIVSALIPMSMIITIFIMDQLAIGLDQISLAALIIALGMLVDNGIVMSESVLVSLQKGKKVWDAAIESANELKIPLLTSSLTTSAAFLPIYLAESSMGEYTASLFKVVTITLLCSWVLSLTMIPMLCVLLLKNQKTKTQNDSTSNSQLQLAYNKILHTVLRRPFMTLAGIILIFIGSLQLMAFIPNLFFPPSDRPFFTLDIELPIGTDIEQTEAIVNDLEQYLNTLVTKPNIENTEPADSSSSLRDKGVINWITYVGYGGVRYLLSHTPKSALPSYALLIINTTGADVNGELMIKLEDYLNKNHPDVTASARLIENGKAILNPVEVRIFGKDQEQLFTLVNRVKDKFSEIEGLKNIDDDWGQRIKKLLINIDQDRAKRAGVTSEDVALSLQTNLTGLQLTEFNEDTDSIPVLLRGGSHENFTIEDIQALSIFSSSTGESIPLEQVATLEIQWEASRILRRDRLKTVTVGAQLESGSNAADSVQKILPWLIQDAKTWPQGYRYELGGESESSGDASKSISDKLPIAVFIILILLVSQFNSFRKPVIILSTIPLGLIGVIWGLFLANSFMGFMTLLGIISLAGIVINNAIVLIESIKAFQEEQGLTIQQAIIEACNSRLRPILLTTATTVLGLLPLYFGGGEMWEPMAIGIIAGLLFSTVLTLIFIPTLYSILYKVSYTHYSPNK